MLKNYVFTLVIIKGHPDLGMALKSSQCTAGKKVSSFKNYNLRICVNDRHTPDPITTYLLLPGWPSFVILLDMLAIGQRSNLVPPEKTLPQYKDLSWLVELKNTGHRRNMGSEVITLLKQRLWGFKSFTILGASDTSAVSDAVHAIKTNKMDDFKKFLASIKRFQRLGMAALENENYECALAHFYEARILTSGFRGMRDYAGIANVTPAMVRSIMMADLEVCGMVADIYIHLDVSSQIDVVRRVLGRPDLSYTDLHHHSGMAVTTCLRYVHDQQVPDPKHLITIKCLFQFAVIRRLLGELDLAQEHIEQALQLSPNHQLCKIEQQNIERARHNGAAVWSPNFAKVRDIFAGKGSGTARLIMLAGRNEDW